MAGSDRCCRSTHHPSKQAFQQCIQPFRSKWIRETLSPDLFVRENAPKDGWCFFHCMGKLLFQLYLKRRLALPQNRSIQQQSPDPIIKFFAEVKELWILPENITDTSCLSLKQETAIAKALQKVASTWVLDHLYDKHDVTGELLLEMLLDSHEIESLEEYQLEVSEMEKAGPPSEAKEEENLPEKNWGSVCEQYALAKHFGLNVWVLLPSRFSKSDTGQYQPMLARVVRKNVTRYMITSKSNGYSEDTSLLEDTIFSAIDGKDMLNLTCSGFPPEILTKVQTDRDNTIFLLLFLLEDSDGDDVSHYNSLQLASLASLQ